MSGRRGSAAAMIGMSHRAKGIFAEVIEFV